jgi:hypothetical protein
MTTNLTTDPISQVVIRGEGFTIRRRVTNKDSGVVWLEVEPTAWLGLRNKFIQFAKRAGVVVQGKWR